MESILRSGIDSLKNVAEFSTQEKGDNVKRIISGPSTIGQRPLASVVKLGLAKSPRASNVLSESNMKPPLSGAKSPWNMQQKMNQIQRSVSPSVMSDAPQGIAQHAVCETMQNESRGGSPLVTFIGARYGTKVRDFLKSPVRDGIARASQNSRQTLMVSKSSKGLKAQRLAQLAQPVTSPTRKTSLGYPHTHIQAEQKLQVLPSHQRSRNKDKTRGGQPKEHLNTGGCSASQPMLIQNQHVAKLSSMNVNMPQAKPSTATTYQHHDSQTRSKISQKSNRSGHVSPVVSARTRVNLVRTSTWGNSNKFQANFNKQHQGNQHSQKVRKGSNNFEKTTLKKNQRVIYLNTQCDENEYSHISKPFERKPSTRVTSELPSQEQSQKTLNRKQGLTTHQNTHSRDSKKKLQETAINRLSQYSPRVDLSRLQNPVKNADLPDFAAKKAQSKKITQNILKNITASLSPRSRCSPRQGAQGQKQPEKIEETQHQDTLVQSYSRKELGQHMTSKRTQAHRTSQEAPRKTPSSGNLQMNKNVATLDPSKQQPRVVMNSKATTQAQAVQERLQSKYSSYNCLPANHHLQSGREQQQQNQALPSKELQAYLDLARRIQSTNTIQGQKTLQTEVIKSLNQSDKSMMNYVDHQCFQIQRDNANLLQYLCYKGKHYQIIDLLLKKKKKIDKDEGTLKNGDTALHLACMGLNKKAVEKLLLAAVNVNIQNVEKETPLHILIKLYQKSDENRELIEELIETIAPFGADSLKKRDLNNKLPQELVSSESLKQILIDAFEDENLFKKKLTLIKQPSSGGEEIQDNDLDEFDASESITLNQNKKENNKKSDIDINLKNSTVVKHQQSSYKQYQQNYNSSSGQKKKQTKSEELKIKEQQTQYTTNLRDTHEQITVSAQVSSVVHKQNATSISNFNQQSQQQAQQKKSSIIEENCGYPAELERGETDQGGSINEKLNALAQLQQYQQIQTSTDQANGLNYSITPSPLKAYQHVSLPNCDGISRALNANMTLQAHTTQGGQSRNDINRLGENIESKDHQSEKLDLIQTIETPFKMKSIRKDEIKKFKNHLIELQQSSEKNQQFLKYVNVGQSFLGSSRLDSDSRAAEDPAEIGPDNFVAHQLLGTGSFGEVFLVEEVATKELYAMKVLSKDKIHEQNLLKYAFAEKEIMAEMTRIEHPFVVKIKYTFQTEESLYMIMQFCSGGDLSQYLELEGSFSEEKARGYMTEIICGIEALHRQNIIFRDLKPDNIVLDEKGHALLTDFGLSRQGIQAYTHGADSFCGSYAYLAPEMILKSGHGKAVDWYLIGVVLYELVTGLPPFYDDEKETLFANITNNPLEFPPESDLRLSSACRDILQKLLIKDPSKRLGTLRGMQDIKDHEFFAGVDWQKVARKEQKSPNAYLSDMAMDIIQKQPFMLKDHPKTRGKLCRKGHPLHVQSWELNMTLEAGK